MSKIDLVAHPELIWEHRAPEYRYNKYLGMPIHIEYKDKDPIHDSEAYVIFTNMHQTPKVHVYEGFNLRTNELIAYDADFIFNHLWEGYGWFKFPNRKGEGRYRISLVSQRKWNSLRKLWQIQDVQEN